MNQSSLITHSGIEIDILDPKPEQITLTDIAEGLSREIRFSGNTRDDYTVAQHSVFVASILEMGYSSPGTVRRGLLHDASEAYLGDVISPLKRHLFDYIEIEKRWESAINLRFFPDAGVLESVEFGKASVKRADELALLCEVQTLVNYPAKFRISEEEMKTRTRELSQTNHGAGTIYRSLRFGTWDRHESIDNFLRIAAELTIL